MLVKGLSPGRLQVAGLTLGARRPWPDPEIGTALKLFRWHSSSPYYLYVLTNIAAHLLLCWSGVVPIAGVALIVAHTPFLYR